jgi:hypothetical protein
MSVSRQQDIAHLFLVRLRVEELEAGQVEWRGRVQRVVNAEPYRFCGCAALVAQLLTMLPDLLAHDGTDPLLFEAEE